MTLTIRGDMKHVMKAFSALVLTTAVVLAGKAEANTSLQFEVGYRSDDLHWAHRVPDAIRLNTKSKLQFKDLEIFQIGAKLKSTCGECVYYRIEGHYGWITDGTLRESDQIALPASGPLTPATQTCVVTPVLHNKAKNKYAADFNIAFGYPIQQCWCTCLQIVPTVGFSYDTIRINAKNRETVVGQLGEETAGEFNLHPRCGSCNRSQSCGSSSSSSSSAVGQDDSSSSSSSCCGFGSSKYRATVWGPWIGFDLAYCHQECWNVYGEFQFNFGRGRRDRSSCVGLYSIDNYRRTRSTYGFSAKVGSLYFFRCNWFIDGNLYYKRWYSDRSRDHLNWRQLGFNVGVGYVF